MRNKKKHYANRKSLEFIHRKLDNKTNAAGKTLAEFVRELKESQAAKADKITKQLR